MISTTGVVSQARDFNNGIEINIARPDGSLQVLDIVQGQTELMQIARDAFASQKTISAGHCIGGYCHEISAS